MDSPDIKEASVSHRDRANQLFAEDCIARLQEYDTLHKSFGLDAEAWHEILPSIQKNWTWASQRVSYDHQAASVCCNYYRSAIMHLPGRTFHEQAAWCDIVTIAAGTLGDRTTEALVLGIKARLLLFHGLSAHSLAVFDSFQTTLTWADGIDPVEEALEDGRIGLVLLEAGVFKEAHRYLVLALSVLDHPDTKLRNIYVLKQLFTLPSPSKRLEALADRFLKHVERKVLPHHPIFIFVLHSRAVSYMASGKTASAERLLRIAREAGPPQDPQQAQVADMLGLVLQQKGRFEEARGFLLEGLRLREHWLGNSHLDTGLSTAHLASLCRAQGDIRAAKHLWARTVRIMSRAKGRARILYASSLKELGLIYVKQSRYTKANELLSLSLTTATEVLGEDNSELATYCAARSEACYDPNSPQLQTAESLLLRAMKLRESRSILDPKRTAYRNQLRIVQAFLNTHV